MQANWHKSCALEVSSSRLQRALAARERSYTGTDGATLAKLTQTLFSAKSPLGVSKCFFCDLIGPCEDETPSQVMYERTKDVKSHFLHRITSLNRNLNIRKAATEMGDIQLLAKLSKGDLIAREVKYHKKCMTKFSNSKGHL